MKREWFIFFHTWVIFFFIPVFLMVITVKGIYANPAGQENGGTDSNAWHILADEISYAQDTDIIIAMGNVVVSGKNRQLTADFVRYQKKDMKVFAKGTVVFNTGEDILTGDSMWVDLEKEMGEVRNGTLFIQSTNFYLKGKKIEKTGEKTYYLEDVSITTCPPENPDWKITGDRLKVTLEGYGVVNNAAFWAKKLPMIYTPYWVFPAKTKRQTGFLPPQFSDSDRRGREYEQPFFWAINDSMDATINSHYMGTRGAKAGFEFRYMLDHGSKGTIMYDYLRDSKVDNGVEDETDNWGYQEEFDDANELIRPNSDRYWFRMKHDHFFSNNVSAKMDLDIVSDQDFLQDFNGGYFGFKETDYYFGNIFGRPLDEYEDDFLAGTSEQNRTRMNRINFNKRWTHYMLDGEFRWNDHVINRCLKDTDSTEHKLPVVKFNSSRQKIGNSRLSWGFGSEYVRYYRADGKNEMEIEAIDQVEALKMHRLDFHPKTYLDLGYTPYFSFVPSLGLQETVWYVDEYEAFPEGINSESDDLEQVLKRGIYDVKLDFSTEVERVFHDVGFPGVDRIKHTIKPQVVYDYIPEIDQSPYPNFFDDPISGKNLITYSIEQRFTLKKVTSDTHLKNGNSRNSESLYKEFCYFKLSQSYDRNKAEDDMPEPYSPISGILNFDPFKYLALDAKAAWSHYDSRFESHNVAVRLSDKRGDRLLCDRQFIKDQSESITVELYLVLLNQLSLSSKLEYDLENEKKIESNVGLLYKAGCWFFEFNISEDENNKRTYQFMINLYGLGGMGSSIERE